MSIIHGRKGQIDISGYTLTTVVGWSYEESADTVETTTMSSTSKTFLAGLVQGSGTIDLKFDTTFDQGFEALKDKLRAGETVSFTGTPSTENPATKATGDLLVVGMSYSQSYDDVATVSFSYNGVLDWVDS